MASKKQKIADKDRYSIIVPNFKTCYVCGLSNRICIHECFYGVANRQKSINDGLCVPLCYEHHQGSNGIHYNKALDDKVKKQAEKIWIKTYCNEDLTPEEKIEQFIKRYGQNYLNEEDLW